MTLRRGILLGACCLVLGGCAARAPSAVSQQPPPAPTGPSDAEDEAAMSAAVEELQRHKAAAVVPRANSNCQPLCEIGELICAASDRICQIASRHPERPDYTERCRGAEQDCQTARRDCDGCQ